jgi:hypothetical protein
MTKPDKDEWPQKPLSKAHTKLIKGTSESARVPRQPMLDELEDEKCEIFETFDRDFARLFDDPEKI